MDKKQLASILTELSQACKAITNEEQIQPIMDKFDMTFAGKSFNCINTIELCHTIDKVFHINISLEELNALIPVTCSELGMETIPMLPADDSLALKPYAYQINL